MHLTPAQRSTLDRLVRSYLHTIRPHLDDLDCLTAYLRCMIASGFADALQQHAPADLASAARCR